jgi:hypothetical protein
VGVPVLTITDDERAAADPTALVRPFVLSERADRVQRLLASRTQET